MISKEAIITAITITTTTDPAMIGLLANNGAQTTPHPSVYARKIPSIAVLEVNKPASVSGVDISNDNGLFIVAGSLKPVTHGTVVGHPITKANGRNRAGINPAAANTSQVLNLGAGFIPARMCAKQFPDMSSVDSSLV